MSWQSVNRHDGKIALTLDDNVWDFLFAGRINLATELPQGRFNCFITREVEMETRAIPNDEARTGLRSYVASTIECCGIETT